MTWPKQSSRKKCENDPLCRTFKIAAEVLSYVSRASNVKWFAWGDFAVNLLSERTPMYPSIDIRIASHHDSNSVKAFEMIAYLYKNINCSVDGDQIYLQLQCKDDQIRVNVFGKAYIFKSSNELRITGENLLRNVSYKLSRFFPLRKAPYFDTCVPVPNDPLYVFSHVVPSKGTYEAAMRMYRYKQGCNGLCSNKERQGTLNQGYCNACENMITFCIQCSIDLPRDTFLPLKTIINEFFENKTLYLEDFLHVIPLEKGNGTYVLNKPGGSKQNKLSWSQFGQDLYVDKYFHSKHSGFFIEIGGYDGERFSNTLFLEKIRHWDGLVIEAIPRLYNQIKFKDRNCHILNACVSSNDEVQVFIDAEALSTSKQAMTKRHKDRIEREHMQQQNSSIKVYCKRLVDILNRLNQTRIDYFSLDVEGGELSILSEIPWEKIDIHVFTVETDQHRDEILTFMNSKGYKNIQTIGSDDIFIKSY